MCWNLRMRKTFLRNPRDHQLVCLGTYFFYLRPDYFLDIAWFKKLKLMPDWLYTLEPQPGCSLLLQNFLVAPTFLCQNILSEV